MRADAQRKRQLIIDAASRIYRTVPDANITLEAIARDAGVGIATLYRHFPTRRDLHVACALDLLNHLDDVIAHALMSFDDDPQRRWESLVWSMVDASTGMLVAALAEQRTGDIDPILLDRLERVIDRLGELLARAAGYGLVDPDLGARELAAELIVATRPQSPTINELFPDVQSRLVHHLLMAWRQSG